MYVPPSLPQKKPNNTNTTTVKNATQTITDDRSSSATTPVPSTTTSTTTPSNFDPNYILPAPFNIANGFISFSNSFLYLGSIITPDLRDDTDVKSRIKKATAQVGALRSFFRHLHMISRQKWQYTLPQHSTQFSGDVSPGPLRTPLNAPSKYSITVAYAPSSTSTCSKLKNKGSQMPRSKNVQTYQISSSSSQEGAYAGLVSLPLNRLLRRLLAAWVQNPHKRGRPQATLCNTMIDSLQQVLQDQVSDQAPLSEWIDTARDVKLWNDIIDQWHEITCQLSFTIISDTLQ
jgi:hypothetical protein